MTATSTKIYASSIQEVIDAKGYMADKGNTSYGRLAMLGILLGQKGHTWSLCSIPEDTLNIRTGNRTFDRHVVWVKVSHTGDLEVVARHTKADASTSLRRVVSPQHIVRVVCEVVGRLRQSEDAPAEDWPINATYLNRRVDDITEGTGSNTNLRKPAIEDFAHELQDICDAVEDFKKRLHANESSVLLVEPQDVPVYRALHLLHMAGYLVESLSHIRGYRMVEKESMYAEIYKEDQHDAEEDE